MIYGIGHDMVELARIRSILDKSIQEKFISRILTSKEKDLLQGREGRKIEFVAGRFAVKEAVSKAFGCGIGSYLGFQDIEVLPDALGKPICTLSEEALAGRLQLDFQPVIHVSITHEISMASAYVIIEKLS
jgi:holo-[acyl-carrier protein] synthase